MYDSREPYRPTQTNWWHKARRQLAAYRLQRGMVFGLILVGALLAFELFNYTTTDFALADLLGDIRFAGVRWAMILAIAFCGMDFAGIARLFTPEPGRTAKLEVWYLLGAWFLAATMNAALTWWGVSIALLERGQLGNEIMSRDELIAVVPVFVAVLVWLIRILIIGTFSVAGERLFTQVEEAIAPRPVASAHRPASAVARPAPLPTAEAELEFDQRPRPIPADDARRVPVARPVIAPQPVRPAPKPAASYAPTNGTNKPAPRPAESSSNADRF